MYPFRYRAYVLDLFNERVADNKGCARDFPDVGSGDASEGPRVVVSACCATTWLASKPWALAVVLSTVSEISTDVYVQHVKIQI